MVAFTSIISTIAVLMTSVIASPAPGLVERQQQIGQVSFYSDCATFNQAGIPPAEREATVFTQKLCKKQTFQGIVTHNLQNNCAPVVFTSADCSGTGTPEPWSTTPNGADKCNTITGNSWWVVCT